MSTSGCLRTRMILVLLSALLCACGALQSQETGSAASPRRGGAIQAPPPITSPPQGQSSIIITCMSPVELLVIDPQGRRLGDDPIAGTYYDEIPGAYYDSAGLEDDELGVSESDPNKLLYISGPVGSDYHLTITGTREGTYTCQFVGQDVNGAQSSIELKNIPVYVDQVQQFIFSFDGSPCSKLRLWGGFSGVSRETKEGRGLLTYATPTRQTMKLPAGKHDLVLLVFYDRRVISSSFAATVNGKSVVQLFHPRAGGWELVEVPLEPGSNNIELTINGKVGKRVVISTDTLQVVVM